jgi:cyanophycin synthetase
MSEDSMRIIHVSRLRGPNRYLSRPVAVALVDLKEYAGRETSDLPGFAANLLTVLPGLAEHHCGAGMPNGLVEKMERGTFFGHVAEHVTLELSHLIGREVNFGRTLWAGRTGLFTVLMECPIDEWAHDPVPNKLLTLAIRIITELADGEIPKFSAELAEIATVYERSRLGVSSQALADAARQRGIPVRRLSDATVLQLGYGRHRRRLWAAMTERTSAIGVDIACDKEMTKHLLDIAGIPVPDGLAVHSAEEAAEAFAELGAPVVVKPVAGNHGQHVFLELRSVDEVVAAYQEIAANHDNGALVESYIVGTDYRVLMVGGRLVAATELRAAHVVGDGHSDIAALVEQVNSDPRRGEGHDRVLTKIALDAAALSHLADQGHQADSVPAVGEVVWLRRNANLSTGGTGRDVTDLVAPDVARLCSRVAAAVELDVCGIDLRLPDIGVALVPGAGGCGAVIEVNASPGLRMHLSPSCGQARDVAGAIIDEMYPPGSPSRIPIVSVTGTNGKTTTVRMIAHVLRATGIRVGMTSTEGVYVDDRLVYRADASGPRSADMVLADPCVQAAVLETARGGIVRRGLAYDAADVAVITNITRDHLGVDGLETLDDLVDVKSLVAEKIVDGGCVVLNADDDATAELADSRAVLRRGPVIRMFSLTTDNPVLLRHVRQGGIGYTVDGDWLVEAQGVQRTALFEVADIPVTLGGAARFNVANALAAVAACRALGVSIANMAAALSTFDTSLHNPGRCGVYRVEQRTVVIDYAHNAAALTAVGELLRRRWGGNPVVVLTLPGDRNDDLVSEAAAALAGLAGHVVVYEDTDLRGRQPGEMTKLITSALNAVDPGIVVMPCSGVEDSFATALALATPEDPVLLIYERFAPVLALLTRHGAVEESLVAAGAAAIR